AWIAIAPAGIEIVTIGAGACEMALTMFVVTAIALTSLTAIAAIGRPHLRWRGAGPARARRVLADGFGFLAVFVAVARGYGAIAKALEYGTDAVLGFTGPMLPVRACVHAPWAPILGLSYAVELDAFAAIFVAATGLVFAAVVASSDRIGHARAYHALLSVLLAALVGAFVARDLALFLLFWELALAIAALLISQWGGVGRSDAAARVLVTALVGSALYIVVIVSLAVARGSLDTDVLRARPLPASAQLLPAVLLCAAFLVTLPVLPFQSWLMRAFVAGPREVALLLGAGLSSVALYAVVRLCVGLFPQGM